MKNRVSKDPTFVALKRYEYSINALVEKYPEGAPDKVIAQALMISEAEVEELYQMAILKLRQIMGVEP